MPPDVVLDMHHAGWQEPREMSQVTLGDQGLGQGGNRGTGQFQVVSEADQPGLSEAFVVKQTQEKLQVFSLSKCMKNNAEDSEGNKWRKLSKWGGCSEK